MRSAIIFIFLGPPCRSKFGFSALRSTHLKFSFQHSAPHISCRALLHVCSTHLFDVKVFALRSTHLHDISGFSTPLHTFCTPKLEPVFFFFSLLLHCVAASADPGLRPRCLALRPRCLASTSAAGLSGVPLLPQRPSSATSSTCNSFHRGKAADS